MAIALRKHNLERAQLNVISKVSDNAHNIKKQNIEQILAHNINLI